MIAIIILGVLLIEFNLKPRIDFTRDGKTILWYGVKRRKYIILSGE